MVGTTVSPTRQASLSGFLFFKYDLLSTQKKKESIRKVEQSPVLIDACLIPGIYEALESPDGSGSLEVVCSAVVYQWCGRHKVAYTYDTVGQERLHRYEVHRICQVKELRLRRKRGEESL